MKAKYLAKPQNWSKDPPKAASWVWKSIMETRKMVKEGTGKRVSDGKTIDIWQDKWIPGSDNGRLKTERHLQCTIRKAVELITD